MCEISIVIPKFVHLPAQTDTSLLGRVFSHCMALLHLDFDLGPKRLYQVGMSLPVSLHRFMYIDSFTLDQGLGERLFQFLVCLSSSSYDPLLALVCRVDHKADISTMWSLERSAPSFAPRQSNMARAAYGNLAISSSPRNHISERPPAEMQPPADRYQPARMKNDEICPHY